MCGITGLWTHAGEPAALSAIARAMADSLAHRGPDGHGCWSEGGVAIAHRRLAIIDPSAAGAQPMVSGDGRWVLSFNGEIYNHAELRAAMPGTAFRGGSDTESLLAACARWGPAEATARCDGMFAFALWDSQRRELHLARDRMGEKPLYYGLIGGAFAFASELKALRLVPGWSGAIDRDALAWYLRLGYVPDPYAIHAGIRKLPPASLLTLRAPDDAAAPRAWWSLAEMARTGQDAPIIDEREAADVVEDALEAAVRRQMVADVPLGCFLSGGIDSSLIAALMQEASPRPVRTVTIGFSEAAYDEAPWARAVAAHLGTEHHECILSPEDALAVVPLLPAMYDEPLGDSSQIPTFLVAREARRAVTVALSGDGADELFAGYHRHALARRVLRLASLPRPLRTTAIAAMTHAGWLGAFSSARSRGRGQGLGDRLAKAGALLAARTPAERYLATCSFWPSTGATAPAWPAATGDAESDLLLFDQALYLPGDILAKVDRATMAASLEARAPFLALPVIAAAWRIAPALRLAGGRGKRILRELLHRRVPQALVERPKTGFSLPLAEWLRGPLRPWAESLLTPERLARDGLLDVAAITAAWRDHLSGRRDQQYRLWIVLAFLAWRDAAVRP